MATALNPGLPPVPVVPVPAVVQDPNIPLPEEDGDDDDDVSDDGSHYSTDSHCSNVSAVSYELDRSILYEHQSSYKSSARVWKKHYDLGHNVIYDWCTSQELRRFLLNRGLPDVYPQGLTLKYYYIRALEQADKQAIFRFMDLAAELRNTVYRELLLFPDACCIHHKYCFPQILQICRAVHQEATDVLYAETTINCSFSVSTLNQYSTISSVVVHTDPFDSTKSAALQRIPSGIKLYPGFLRKVRSISIHLCMEDNGFTGHTLLRLGRTASAHLATLASFLMDEHRLRSLEICVHVPKSLNDKIGTMLYPLRRLRSISNVKFIGNDVPRQLQTEISNAVSASTPVCNTIGLYQVLANEGQALAALSSKVNPGVDTFDVQIMDRIGRIWVLMAGLEDDAAWEAFCGRKQRESSFCIWQSYSSS